MNSTKLIKTFKNKSWKLVLLSVFLFTGGVLNVINLFGISKWFIIVAALLAVPLSITGHSVFRIYPKYMVCYIPIQFWRYKRLFYYKKISKIVVRSTFQGLLINYTVKIHTLDQKIFDYKLNPKQLSGFVETLREFGVQVKVHKSNLKPKVS